MIGLNNITVTRLGKELLKDFSWTINQGENWVIQGNNGAGKTTLLETIAGHLIPAKGQVFYDFITEKDWEARYAERKSKIHYIPAHALQVFLSGYHDLFYQQRYYSMDNASIPTVKNIIGDDIVNLNAFRIPTNFQIEHLLNLEITQLSNGQLKKLLLLKNFLKSIPKVLLLDYPFEGLDQESRSDLINFIDYFATTFNIQIILVDHAHDLPGIINRRLVLDNLKIKSSDEWKAKDTFQIKSHLLSSSKPNLTADVVVEMKDVSISYSGKTIIDKLNWSIRKGERWALTGKNGSGKTTLFSIIYADHPLAYGQEVYLFGRRRGSGESIWNIKKRINYFGPEQIHFLNPKSILFTAKEYIINLHPLHNREHLDNLIDYFNASNFISKPVRHLSSGELQSMMLIDFFISENDLLLLDEPFQFLDPHQKEKVRTYLTKFLTPDTTLILITHYEDDIKTWTQLRKEL